MTIKKLTVAAAIAVGIATCSFSNAMAACPCNTCDPCPCAPQQSCCPMPACNCPQPACATCANSGCAELDKKQVYAYPAAIYGDNNYVGEQTNAIYSTETAFMTDCCDSLAASKAGLITGAAMPLNHGCGCGCNTGFAAPMAALGSGCGCNPTPCDCAIGGVPVAGPCGRGGCGIGYALGSMTGAACDCLPVINAAPCSCQTGAAAPCDCGCGCNSGCATTIQSCDSMKVIERSFASCNSPCECGAAPCPSCTTGAASSMISTFCDVPSGYWAGCAIDKLACNNIIAGYPDRTFKPTLPVSRAEFASMMVKGLNMNLDCQCLSHKKIFKDVSCNHWANPVIAKAVEAGILCGYPNNMFKPVLPVSRAEALTAMAHGINCNMDSCQAEQILSQYCDGNKVPDWARIPVAKALQSGLLKDSPKPNIIDPCNDASRAEIASMLYTTRIASGLDCPVAASKPACECENACPASSDCECTKTSTITQTEKIVNIPVLKVKFQDEINAKSSTVGQRFVANTSEEITINGQCYPCGSKVYGKIVEVIRPSGCQKGGLKVAFTSIEGCDGCKCDLPRQILSAQVSCAKNQNFIARLVASPFTLLGSLVGTTARTVGGGISNLGNAFENVSGGVGIASSEIFQGQFMAAGRSIGDAIGATVMAPIDLTRTALSGTVGLFQTTGDEVAYLVDPSGAKISAINPKEVVKIAFGCH